MAKGADKILKFEALRRQWCHLDLRQIYREGRKPPDKQIDPQSDVLFFTIPN